MCRLFAVTSNEPLSPMMAIDALNEDMMVPVLDCF